MKLLSFSANATLRMLSLLGALAVVAPATVVADWNLPATAVSSSGPSAYDVRLAVDKKGNAAAVWTSSTGLTTIYAAIRPKDGAWSVPTELSQGVGTSSEQPDIAFDAKGNALAVWQSYSGSEYRIHGSIRPKDGVFGPSFQISTMGTDCDSARVVFDRKGNAVVAWHASGTIEAAVRPKDGTFGTPELVSGALSAESEFDLNADPKGNVHISWLYDNSGSRVLAVSTRLKGATSFSVPVQVSANGVDANTSKIIGDKKGNLLVVWDSYDGMNEAVFSSFKPKAGSFGTPIQLSTAPYAYYPQAQFDSKGNAIVIWETYDGTYNTAQIVERPKDGSFGSVTTLSPALLDAEEPTLVIDKKRNVTAIWREDDGVEERVVVRRRLKDELTFGAPVILQDSGNSLSRLEIAADGKGNLVTAYPFPDDMMNERIFSAIFTID